MEAHIVYIPMDRRQALAHHATLPERSVGAALFADVSGFTAMTEALVQAIGPQRGAEELPRRLNQVYDALIAEVHSYGGSVLGFSGDAITCWFDIDMEIWQADTAHAEQDESSAKSLKPATVRAVACALAMQRAMQQFANIVIAGVGSVSLAIKISVASGPVRRFIVGDPSIQQIDTITGTTLDRLAAGEHVATRNEVLVDRVSADSLDSDLEVTEWRTDAETGERFAVVTALHTPVLPTPWPALASDAIRDTQAQPWLLPPVYEHLRNGLGEFLTELRPTTALFLRFGGIDYDHDQQACDKLNTFVLRVQRVLQRYDSYLIQLTIGDKGSYLYACFGAPISHEDDPVRATLAALELRDPHLDYIQNVQIGISQGRTRTGAYGSLTRRTYGALGDEVNLAARLMQNAPPGQVLVSQVIQQFTGDRFVWETLPPLKVKGKALPIQAYRLIAAQNRRTMRMHELSYALPMVGRRQELTFVAERIKQVLSGQGRIVGISAEAGMGKSRLIAEVLRLAEAHSLEVYGGECQSYGTNSSYLVWQSIWRGFFELDSAASQEEQIEALERSLAQIDPGLLPRLPLLGPLLHLTIPDNALTQDFEPRLRQESLHELLIRCVRVRASTTPLLLVLEDCHWLDPVSHDLIEALGRAIIDLPVLLLLAYRPLQMQRLLAPHVAHFDHFSELTLDVLPASEVEELLRLKFEHLFSTVPDEITPALVAQINNRAQGNPFYVEELLNYLHDRDLDPCNPADLDRIELPTSLYSLILSRIDQLTENQKTLLKLASVIGRTFNSAVLWGISDFLDDQERLHKELDVLNKVDLTMLHTPDPELTYLFKHVVTQEVAYESLPFTTRAVLHDQIGQYIEQNYADTLDTYVDLLAFHYDRSNNLLKRQQYLLKAGEIAQATYANTAAIDYYQRVLAILPPDQQGDIQRRLGQVFELIGKWQEAHTCYQVALEAAMHTGDQHAQARLYALTGELLRKQGNYAEARIWLDQARAMFEDLEDQSGVAQTLNYAGSMATQQGNYLRAHELYEGSLVIRRNLNDQPMIASLLSNLGILAYHLTDVNRARDLFEQSLAMRREVGNPLWIANSLDNLGMLALDQADYAHAHGYIEESLALERAIGARSATAISLNNLGKIVSAQGDYATARSLYLESLLINRELGDPYYLTYLLEDIGVLAARLGQPERAMRLVGAAEALREQIGAARSPREQASLDTDLQPARSVLSEEVQEAVLAAGRAMDMAQAIEEALHLE